MEVHKIVVHDAAVLEVRELHPVWNKVKAEVMLVKLRAIFINGILRAGRDCERCRMQVLKQ